MSHKILFFTQELIKKKKKKNFGEEIKGIGDWQRLSRCCGGARGWKGDGKGPALTINIAGDKISRNKKGSLREVDTRHPKEH